MANKTIAQLPLQTGITDNDLLAIVDSGETTTSRIKVSTLLSSAGGAFQTGDATDSIVPAYSPTSRGVAANTTYVDKLNVNLTNALDIDNGTNNSSVTIGGYGTRTISGAGLGSAFVGGRDPQISGNANFAAGQFGSSIAGENNGMVAGRGNFITAGEYSFIGGGRSNVTSNLYSGILAGQSNTNNGQWSAMLGGQSNTIGSSNCRGVAIAGGNGNNMTNEDWSIVAGLSNTIQNGERNAILGGTSNTIDEGVHNGMLAGQANVMTFARVSAIVGSYVCDIRGDERTTPLGISNSQSSFIRQTVGSGTGRFEGTQSSIYNSISSDIAGQVGNETYLATMIGSESSNIPGGTNGTVMLGCSGRTGTSDYTTYVETLEAFDGIVMTDYANLNFANDSLAAASGVPLGGMYHNAGNMRIRIT
jgi:hypothetical protein